MSRSLEVPYERLKMGMPGAAAKGLEDRMRMDRKARGRLLVRRGLA